MFQWNKKNDCRRSSRINHYWGFVHIVRWNIIAQKSYQRTANATVVFNFLLLFFVLFCTNNKIFQYLNRSRDKLWIHDALKHNSPFTCICWITALVIFACSFSLIIISIVYNELWYLFDDGVLIFILLIVNLATVLWDNKLRHEEMLTKLDHLMIKLNCKKIRLKNISNLFE